MDARWSIVIPTLWRGIELARMLPLLDALECVEEILVINNSTGAVPSMFAHEWQRTRFITYGTNLYVNPSWNIGISLAKSPLVCLFSDDVLIDPKVFGWLLPQFATDLGPVGLEEQLILNQTSPPRTIFTDPLPLTPQYSLRTHAPNEKMRYGFGVVMWLHRSLFIPIPENYLIYHGDNWIYGTSRVQGSAPRTINAQAISRNNSTSHSRFANIRASEMRRWNTGLLAGEIAQCLRYSREVDVNKTVASVKTLGPIYENIYV